MAAPIRFKYLGRGSPLPMPFKSAGAFAAGDPVKVGVNGTVTINAAGDKTSSGIAGRPATATGAEMVGVYPWSEHLIGQLPLSGTVVGDLSTAAGQTAAGATLGGPVERTPGATLIALIGAFYTLAGATGAWTVNLASTAADELLQLAGFTYNEGTGLYEAEVVVPSAARLFGVTAV